MASAGTVTAFYFASKSNEQTQKNLLDAAFGTPTVDFPELEGMNVGQAKRVLENVKLKAVSDPPDAAPDAMVGKTIPSAGTKVKPGDVVTLAVKAPAAVEG